MKIRRICLGLFAAALTSAVGRGDDSVAAQLQGLAEQNRRLQEQVQAQQWALEALTAQLREVQKSDGKQEAQLRELRAGVVGPAEAAGMIRREREVRISGEVGLAFFKTGNAGSAPKSEFRVDDAKVFIEAPVAKNTYFMAEVNVAAREASSPNFELGEFYVDFEDVSGRWGGPARWLNVRAGRFNSPFGEEYQVRGPIANPLISHSLADMWGVDIGAEAYGAVGVWQYAVAVQNGGLNPLRDFNADKAFVGRVGWDPLAWLHLSASAMRTGELRVDTETVPGDGLSSLWFGNGFLRALGPAKSTTTFWGSLWEFDAVARWKSGRVAAALGGVRFGDNDRTANNSRQMRYGMIEATQTLAGGFFGATRFSWVDAPGGYPLVGWGNFGRYFFAPPLTTAMRRMSLGFGYRIGPPLVLKLEYSWESGRMTTGARRDQEDFFGAEAGLRF